MENEENGTVLGWHFLRKDGCLGYGDGRKVEVGQTLSVEGYLVLGSWGMHASRRIVDALQYAAGPIVCRVELSKPLIDGHDKLCSRSRTVLAMGDMTTVLHEFSCWCAERALMREREEGREPDARCWAAIEAKRKWIKAEIGDQELAAARGAARAAARGAAWGAARAAAWDAAWAAAWDAWGAAWAAAWDEENAELERRACELLGITLEANSGRS